MGGVCGFFLVRNMGPGLGCPFGLRKEKRSSCSCAERGPMLGVAHGGFSLFRGPTRFIVVNLLGVCGETSVAFLHRRISLQSRWFLRYFVFHVAFSLATFTSCFKGFPRVLSDF